MSRRNAYTVNGNTESHGSVEVENRGGLLSLPGELGGGPPPGATLPGERPGGPPPVRPGLVGTNNVGAGRGGAARFRNRLTNKAGKALSATGRAAGALARSVIAGTLGTIGAAREGVYALRRKPRIYPNGGANSKNTNTGVANSTNTNTGAAAKQRVANAREKTARQRAAVNANARAAAALRNRFLQQQANELTLQEQRSANEARWQKAKNANEAKVLEAREALAKSEQNREARRKAKAEEMMKKANTYLNKNGNLNNKTAFERESMVRWASENPGSPANNGRPTPANNGRPRPANNGRSMIANNGRSFVTNNGRSNNRNQNLSGFNTWVTGSVRGRLRKTQGYARLLADLISVYPKYASGRVNASNEAILNRVRITGYRKATFNRVRSLVGTADGGEVTEAIAQVIDNIKDDGLVQYVVPLTKQILRAKKMSRMNP